jgi:hypothetical protein
MPTFNGKTFKVPEFTPNLDKCVITKNDITMFITDRFTGDGVAKPSPNRGGIVVARLQGETDEALYKRATESAVSSVAAMRTP